MARVSKKAADDARRAAHEIVQHYPATLGQISGDSKVERGEYVHIDGSRSTGYWVEVNVFVPDEEE